MVLFRTTWDIKRARPERAVVAWNPDKIRLTLLEPGLIVQSKLFKTTFLYVRRFHEYTLPGGHVISSVTRPLELVVVLDARGKLIRTIYPARFGSSRRKGTVTWEK